MDELFPTHLEAFYGLRVDESRLPNAGKGLFAVQHFRAGSLVVPYMGRCMNDPMLMAEYVDKNQKQPFYP
jgi:hypothetical protein